MNFLVLFTTFVEIKKVIHKLNCRFLFFFDSPLPQQEAEKLWKIMQFYSQMLSQLDDDTAPTEERSLPPDYGPDVNTDPSVEIEDMVRAYFERLYTGELSADQFIAVLNACHDSKDLKQADFFSCTVHTLVSCLDYY